MAAVVHAHDCQGRFPVHVAVQQQGGRGGHGMAGMSGAFLQVFRHRRQVGSVDLPQGIPFFGNGEGYDLQGRGSKDFTQPLPVRLFPRLGHQGLRHGGDDFLVNGGVGVQRDTHGQVVVAAVDHPDIVHIKGIRGDDAAFRVAAGQQALLEGRDESAEDIACPEMDPYRGLPCFFPHGRDVKSRQLDPGLFPCGGILKAAQIYFHLLLSKGRVPGIRAPVKYSWVYRVAPVRAGSQRLFAGIKEISSSAASMHR